jgi:hypothetical protein
MSSGEKQEREKTHEENNERRGQRGGRERRTSILTGCSMALRSKMSSRWPVGGFTVQRQRKERRGEERRE